MKIKTVIAALMTVLAVSASAHDEIQGVVPISKATELAVHRIERLVTLKKIDETFRTQLIGLRAERSQENGATYKVVGIVSPASNGKSSAITLWQDNNGKTLAHSVDQQSAPANPFSWPDKDPVSLMEEGLHFVLEGWAKHPEVKAFYTGLESISLRPVQGARGELIAQFQVKSDDDARTLIINLDSGGRFLSHELK